MIHLVLITQAILEILIVVLGYIAVVIIAYFVGEEYKTWKYKRCERKCRQQLKKAYEEFLRQRDRMRLRKVEREKYPLFYWRELVKEKLEGLE